MNGVETSDVYPILTVFLSIVGSAELLRFNFDWFNQLYCFLLGPLMRPTEVKSRINGVVYYLLGKLRIKGFYGLLLLMYFIERRLCDSVVLVP